jgi:hypothetical protein
VVNVRKKKQVIDLYFSQHKTCSEIAEIERVPPPEIYAIIKEEESKQQKHKDQQR